MKKPILVLAACVVVFFAQFTNANEAAFENNNRLTLKTAIDKTLSQNPELQQFMLKGKQLSTNRDFAGFRPGYSLDLEVENFAGSGDFGSFDSAETTLALSSVIELGGKRDSRLQVAQTRINKFNLDKQIQTVDLLSNLTQVFISTLSVAEKISLAKESVGLHETLLRTVQTRVDKGIAQEADLMRAKSAFIEEQLKLEVLQNKLAINYVALASFWGERNPSFNDVSGDLYVFNQVQSFDALLVQVENSPTIQSYASQARLKQAEAQLAKTSSRSDISWNVGVRQFQETDDTALVAGFSIPLFSGKRNRSSYLNAQYEIEAAEIGKGKSLLELHKRLFEAYSQREQAVAAEKRIRLEVIPFLKKASVLTLEGYERGRFTYQDVVSAQRELISAQLIRVEKATIALLNQSIIEQLIAQPLSE